MIESRLESFFREHAPPGIVSAYLYGSHATGRAHTESDIDIGVLADRTHYATANERGELRITLGSALIGALGSNRVDLVVLNDASPLLAREILHARRVYLADSAADREFTRLAESRAADVAPFVERQRHRLLQWVQR